jgi:aminocarboxymuconate-semialdehyde decarboxylase
LPETQTPPSIAGRELEKEKSMLVDIYTHVLPARFGESLVASGTNVGMVKRMMSVTDLHDFDARFRTMDKIGDYRQIISLPNPPIEDFAAPERGNEFARVGNDLMAELVDKHRDRFPAFVAAVSLTDMEGALAELERAITKLGARGVQLFTNIKGRPLDDPDFLPIFEAMARHDLPIFLHPARTPMMTDYPTEKVSRLEMWWCFGWPYETSVAMTRLALSGLFDRLPKIKIITHHFGGMIPFFDKRIEGGLATLGSRTQGEDYSGVMTALEKPLLDYLHMFYADTALFGAGVGLQCGLDFFGTERTLFASDAPFGPIAETRDGVVALDFGDKDKSVVMTRNAEAVLGMRLA